MIYVIGGFLIGLGLLKLSNSNEGTEGNPTPLGSGAQRREEASSVSRKRVIDDLYKDLVSMLQSKKGQFIGLLRPLNNPYILNNVTIVEDNESYTINKRVIHLCTKSPRNGEYYDKNTLMFVVLHELSHVICDDIGHTDKFLQINRAILNFAIKNGYYDPSKPFVENYCSLG